MNELTYELLDKLDNELCGLEMVQKLLTDRTFANYKRVGNETVDINVFWEETAGVWALSELILKQMKYIHKSLQSLLKNAPEKSDTD